jgi:Holliday junction resolvase RusA-like endonuclease
MIEIKIRGTPTAWARAGFGGRFFTPAKQREAGQIIEMEARIAMGSRPLLQGPLELTVVFAYAWPKGLSKKRRLAPAGQFKQTRPDLDNLIKLVCDRLNGIVWLDDSQVASLAVTKVYTPIPSISILVNELLPQEESRGAILRPQEAEESCI